MSDTIPVQVHMLDTRDGKRYVYDTDWWPENGDDVVICYAYGDGNSGCDCNRSLYCGYSIGMSYSKVESSPLYCECNAYDNVIKIEKLIVDGKDLLVEFPDVDWNG